MLPSSAYLPDINKTLTIQADGTYKDEDGKVYSQEFVMRGMLEACESGNPKRVDFTPEEEKDAGYDHGYECPVCKAIHIGLMAEEGALDCARYCRDRSEKWGIPVFKGGSMKDEEKAAELATKFCDDLWESGDHGDWNEFPAEEFALICIKWARENPGWISVEERLPDTSGDYLGVSEEQVLVVRFYDYTQTEGHPYFYNYMNDSAVLYWMPMPPAPSAQPPKSP